MNIQRIACKKGKQVVGNNIQSWTKRRRRSSGIEKGAREYGTERGLSAQLKEELARSHVRDLENKQRAKKEARALDKDFFLSVLNSSATKRDAKSYIQTFSPAKEKRPTATKAPAEKGHTCGVNLGGFYGPAAVEESPKFVQLPARQAQLVKEPQLHIAVVKIRIPQTLSDEIITGIGRTLSQLERLGLISVVVVDCRSKDGWPSSADEEFVGWREMEAEQANRLISAIEDNGTEARLVDNVIGINEKPSQSNYMPTKVHITLRKLLMTPLRRGVIPVIPSVGYTDITQTALPVAASDVILALTREFAGLPSGLLPDEDQIVVREQLRALREEVSLDRLIILDPLGGIPATDRPNGYHVFLNMEQEFEPARQDLLRGLRTLGDQKLPQTQDEKFKVSDLGASNPFSRFVETEFGGPKPSLKKGAEETSKPKAELGFSNPLSKFIENKLGSPQKLPNDVAEESFKPRPENWTHLQNLELVREVLSMLPPSSSALLTTPEEAANSVKDAPFQPARVGTRRQRNPLIHNLLTDKPVFSSSLPVGRLGQQTSKLEPVSPAKMITPTTFAKHGMSVTILPDPTIALWEPPAPGRPRLTLTDSAVDLSRFVHLIEDSFGRKLDVQAYLDRVNDRIAGVIIAGEYEGGALLTWETPHGVPDDGSLESRARMVPYLDKFAVLKRSQGSGGVADLIFKAMVRDCFPDGVVWRSRKTNPVNKWYFERSRGTWKLPDTGWTMFWTTPELSMNKQLFLDYEGVCRAIEPSWADNKALLD